MVAVKPTPPAVQASFLLTDVEGSTRFWIEHPDRAGAAFARHDEVLSQAITDGGGTVVKGTGDGFMAVFDSPDAAVRAAVAGQLALRAEATALGDASRVRMAVNTGEAEIRNGDYYGLGVVVSARLMSAAHGGQILVSSATRRVVGELPEPLGLIDLGQHRLKDLSKPERAYQVVHPDLPAEFPPLRSLPRVELLLPHQLTVFVGRTDELSQVGDLLRGNRLLTLAGSGGVGKTRLAIQAAAAATDDYPDGMWFVDLGAVSGEELVTREVADRLGIAEIPDKAPIDQLTEFLAARRALLILDGCEHVVAACAQLAHRVLSDCPALRVLATSRERLGVDFEVTYRVPSMQVPARGDDTALETLGTFDAVRLFVNRAQLAHPAFELNTGNASAVGAISRRLDGIPLAIELAAAKVASLSPREIADRLDHSLRLLGGGRRAGPSRHQTLRATIDWSFGLLDEEEKTLFARLSVFRGGFDAAAVEAVCAEPGEAEVFDVLVRLIEKSLVTRSTDTSRYGLLESLREYAEERLGEGVESDEVAGRHADYYAGVAEATRAELLGSDQAAWLDRLSREHDNLRAALRYALDSGSVSLAGRIAGAAWSFWKVRGHVSEGRAWLASVLEAPEEPDQAVMTEVLIGAGDLAIDQGDLSAGRSYLQRARARADELADLKAAATITAKMASLPHKAGDLEGAIALSEEALDMARAAGDDWVAGRVLPNLALLYEDLGDHERAGAAAHEAVEVGRRSGNPYLIADAALSAGEIALNREDVGTARRLFEEASASAETVGLEDVGAWALAYLGKLAVATGEHRRARSLLERSLGDFRELESPMGMSWALCHLGRALQGEGDHVAAGRRLEEALEIACEYVRPDVPIAIEALGVLAAETGDHDRAAVLLGAAQGIRRLMGLRLAPPEERASQEVWGSLGDRLGAARRDGLGDQGRAMSIDDAVSFVLGAC